MTKSSSITQKILIWTYERGSLQYDIICVLILAFIFFIPPTFFNKRHNEVTLPVDQSLTTSQPADKVQDQKDSEHEVK